MNLLPCICPDLAVEALIKPSLSEPLITFALQLHPSAHVVLTLVARTITPWDHTIDFKPDAPDVIVQDIPNDTGRRQGDGGIHQGTTC